MSDWGKRMVDVWYNKGLDPDQRLTWEQFYIEQFKDMEQDGEADHADIVRRMRRKYIRGMYMYECVCVCMRYSMQGRLGSSVRRFAAKLADGPQARVRCARERRPLQVDVQAQDRGQELDPGMRPNVPVPEHESEDGRKNLGRLRGTSQIHVCKHNISAAKHETRDRCGATWTSLSSPCPS